MFPFINNNKEELKLDEKKYAKTYCYYYGR